MEPHKEIPIGIDDKPDLNAGPLEYFKKAEIFTLKNYSDILNQISSVRFEEVTIDHFFVEYTWVVHATGFSAKAVGKFMPRLLEAYGPWCCLGQRPFSEAFERIKLVCNNYQKASAVHSTACELVRWMLNHKLSWEEYKQEVLSTPERLQQLPYIGKITCYHLARNIGLLDCVKPDLHLERMRKIWGFDSSIDMCKHIQKNHSQYPLGIIDLVLWFSASTFGTLDIKLPGQR